MNERATIGVLVALMLAGGCIEREGRPVNPCTNVSLDQQIQLSQVDKVDLLFMVDNSGSMQEEQESLAEELERMVAILTTGDFDQDGSLSGPDDFEPVRDLHVGIITSDMGVGGNAVATCNRADFGDDGVLRTAGNTAMGCMATYPTFLEFRPDSGSADPVAFARDVSCVATVGTDGCGFEQQLEAILKAVSPSAPTRWTREGYVPPRFHQSTSGHADQANDGFVRDGSVLAIIPLTDEEDCSAADPELFDPTSPTYSGTMPNLRCFQFGEMALHPISRYVDGLLQLRARDNLLIYAPIVGVPVDLAQQPGAPIDWDALVGPADVRDPRMVERVDPTMPGRLAPSCNTENGVAFPPVRITRVARELEARGAGVTVQSICQDSFANALTQIIRQIARALIGDCIPRDLNREADGRVDCQISITMPEGVPCADLPGAEPILDDVGQPRIEDGRAVCLAQQLVADGAVPSGDGWYYDDFSDAAAASCGGQRIAYSVDPPSGSVVSMSCFQTVQSGADGYGAFCDPGPPPYEAGPAACGNTSIGDTPLECDPVARTCGVRCETDADCRDAGLIGFTCDERPLSALDSDLGSDAPHAFCVNPTC